MNHKSITVLIGSMVQGTVYTGFLPVAPILNNEHDGTGPYYGAPKPYFGASDKTSSFVNNTVFVTPKSNPALVLSAGDFYLNHQTGEYKVKAGASLDDVEVTFETQIPYQKIYNASILP